MTDYPIDANPHHRRPSDDYPRHYLVQFDKTFVIHAKVPEMNTILEVSSWDGEPPDTEEAERTRHAVLLDTDCDAMFGIQKRLIEGDEAVLNALYAMLFRMDVPEWVSMSVLCWDFFRDAPYVRTYYPG